MTVVVQVRMQWR